MKFTRYPYIFILILLGIVLCGYSVGLSRILNVPSDEYPTIQKAISDCEDGDVVLVSEGTYYESIDFLGKSITVASHFWLEGEEEYIGTTILRGKTIDKNIHKSIVSFVNGEDNDAILMGFTLSNGWGTILDDMEARAGGAILCLESTPTITNNLIKQNYIKHSVMVMGGGIFVKNNRAITQENRPMIINNTFCENQTSGCRANYGGAMCIIGDGLVTIENNCFQGNFSMAGGAVATINSYPNFRNNIFLENYANFGGALHMFRHDGPIQHTLNKDGIDVEDQTPEHLLNLMDIDLPPTVTSVDVAHSAADIPVAPIINCTFVRNTAVSYGGALYSSHATPSILNSIFWNNTTVKGYRSIFYAGRIFVNYSDIQGGWIDIPNTYIIEANPEFEDLNSCCLSEDSPCVDAGNPLDIYNDPEDPDKPGFAMQPARGTIRNDMGAYGGPCACRWNTPGNTSRQALEFRTESLVAPESMELYQNYPNPFNPSTTVSFFLEKESQITLRVFNVLGEEVATILSDRVESGYHQLTWNAGNLAGGVYLLRFETPLTVKTRKMILMK